MVAALRRHGFDLAFVTGLLLLAAVPLVLLRGNPIIQRSECRFGLLVFFAVMATLWALLARRHGDVTPLGDPGLRGEEATCGSPWWWALLVAALLAGVTLVSFYTPLRIHFWNGSDEWAYFYARTLPEWLALLQGFDGMNRPLCVLVPAVGLAVSHGDIDGFLWLAAGLCWANGLLLLAVLREALPRARVLAVAAAVLLIVDRSDQSRFFVLGVGNFYCVSLGLLLAGLWLFLRSYRLGSRLLLVLSCLLLAGSLLTLEGGYLLAVLAPPLAWLNRQHRRRLPAWALAWTGTLALLAARFVLFLAELGSGSYQAGQSSAAVRDPAMLLGNLRLHLEAGLSSFQTTGAALGHWRSAAWALALGLAAVGVAVWGGRRRQALSPRRCLIVQGWSALAALLGTGPFLHLSGLYRTQYFAAPGWAVLLASGLCLVGALFGRRAGAAAVAVCVGLLAGNATGEAIAAQQRDQESSPVNFERTAHVFRQVHGVSPAFSPDTLILLVPDDPTRVPPLGGNRCCGLLAERTLGAAMVQVVNSAVDSNCLDFWPDGVSVRYGHALSCPGKAGYDKLVAFRLGRDGTVCLLHRLPARLLPVGSSADSYNPLPLLRPGPVAELPYLRYPPWADRPCDLFDLADGVLLGSGWGPLEWRDGVLSRRVAGQGELVVNPLGRDRRELHLRVEGDRPGRLEALNARGLVVARAALEGRRDVSLEVPAEPSRVGLIRLRVRDDAGAAGPFRVYCMGAKPPHIPPPPPSDIPCGDLTLGKGWYPPEDHKDGPIFRWVANDAEVVLGDSAAGGHVAADVEPGFGPNLFPCRLSLRDEAGRELAAAADVRGRGEVRLGVPTDVKPGAVLRLHAEGGGLSLPNVPEVLHFRAFRCELAAD